MRAFVRGAALVAATVAVLVALLVGLLAAPAFRPRPPARRAAP